MSTQLASREQLARSAFLMYFVVSLIAVPCADWLADLLRSASGAGDFRDGAYVLESLLNGAFGTLALPLGFGALVLFPLAIPLRMTWLASIRHPDWSLRKQAGIGLRRTPACAGSYFLLLTIGMFLLGLLVIAAWLVHSSFDGDPNPRSAAFWTALAFLPFAVGSLLLLAALDLASAASLSAAPFDALRQTGPRVLRALPVYTAFALVCGLTFVAGAALETAPWVLLPALQACIFLRYLARSFWLRAAVRRMTTRTNHAMTAP
ncbi:MAG: hypothetical protein AB8H86_18140 [Polyangiales bacterium]